MKEIGIVGYCTTPMTIFAVTIRSKNRICTRKFLLQIQTNHSYLLFLYKGIKIVAYSPLGCGFLTGSIRNRESECLDENDFRLNCS